ncbi:MAG: hypothetical protein M3Q65_23270 [Chloroflexota bacterium]|nr:hypothetical protein [Chloroflexota bacterium]
MGQASGLDGLPSGHWNPRKSVARPRGRVSSSRAQQWPNGPTPSASGGWTSQSPRRYAVSRTRGWPASGSCGVRVAVLVEARRYCAHAQSEPGTVYTIARTPAGWACECEGYFHTGMCKHLGAVERRASREGWPFGVIAPLAKVARYFPLGEPTLPRVTSASAEERRERGRQAKAELFGAVAD